MLEFTDVPAIVARVELNRTVRDQLLRSIQSPSSNRYISVTDLTNPRQGYYRRVTDPQSPFYTEGLPEFQRSVRSAVAMEKGTRFHKEIEPILAGEAFLENVLWLDGTIKGKTDIFRDRPIELKTTSRRIAFADLAHETDYLEQLGMYCAMADVPDARLLVANLGAGRSPPTFVGADIRYRDLAGIRETMRARALQLQAALDSKDPGSLPRCPWFGKGCDFEAQEICACKESEPAMRPSIALDHVESIQPADAYLLEVEQKLAESAALRKEESENEPPPLYPSSLLYPRKIALERMYGRPEEGPAGQAQGELRRLGGRWARDLVYNAAHRVEGLPYEGRPGAITGLAGRVGTLGGRPFVVRSSKSKFIAPAGIAKDQPQWVLELAFACAQAGSPDGFLILIYERAFDEEERFQVYHLFFRPTADLLKELQDRLDALTAAIGAPAGATEAIGRLPKCRDFMQRDCDYRDRPGCCGYRPPGPGR